MTSKLGNAILNLPIKLVKEVTVMNKEEILAKSREDHKNEDEREKQIRMRAAIPALIGMGVIAITLMVMEILFLDSVLLSRSFGLVFTGAVATETWYLAVTLKKKWWFIAAAGFTISTIISALNVLLVFQSVM